MTHRLGPALFAVVVAAAFFIASASSQTPRSALGTPAASPVASPAGRAVSVTTFVAIHLTDTGVDPQSVEATNGHDLTITLVNDGARPHAFRIDRLAIDVRLLPGHTEIVVIRAPGFGDFPYSSDFAGDERRTGLLTFYS